MYCYVCNRKIRSDCKNMQPVIPQLSLYAHRACYKRWRLEENKKALAKLKAEQTSS